MTVRHPKIINIEHTTRKHIRTCQYAESHLLQLIETIEHQLDATAKHRDLLGRFIHKSKENEKKLRTRLETAQADERSRLSRLLVQVLANRRKTMDNVRRQERSLRQAISGFKRNFRHYLELQKTITNRQIVTGLIEIREKEQAERGGGGGGGGGGLWGKLGMILFAWKTSNAFDDLAKIAGRKK